MTEPLDPDEQAWLDLYRQQRERLTPIAECALPAGRTALPRGRHVHDVVETL